MQPRIEFKHPYFVTPHAIGRFRQRVLEPLGRDLQDMAIVQIVQASLQVQRDPAWSYRQRDGKPCRVFRVKYAGIEYFIPVVKNKDRDWPLVPTILGPGFDRWPQKQEGKNDEREKA